MREGTSTHDKYMVTEGCHEDIVRISASEVCAGFKFFRNKCQDMDFTESKQCREKTIEFVTPQDTHVSMFPYSVEDEYLTPQNLYSSNCFGATSILASSSKIAAKL
jgi:hypothetical protein